MSACCYYLIIIAGSMKKYNDQVVRSAVLEVELLLELLVGLVGLGGLSAGV